MPRAIATATADVTSMIVFSAGGLCVAVIRPGPVGSHSNSQAVALPTAARTTAETGRSVLVTGGAESLLCIGGVPAYPSPVARTSSEDLHHSVRFRHSTKAVVVLVCDKLA